MSSDDSEQPPGGFTHLDSAGRPQMVDVAGKAVTQRAAVAEGAVYVSADTLAAIAAGGVGKGDVLTVAELAGIMAAKRTGELIPLCHPLPLDGVTVRLGLDEGRLAVLVRAEAHTEARTGVEMEALTAVSTACLTVYDMVKARERTPTIGAIALVAKRGGKSGDWQRGDSLTAHLGDAAESTGEGQP